MAGYLRVALVVWLATNSFAIAQPGYRAPRTPQGSPDLSGLWTNVSLTGLERPEAFSGLVATEESAEAYERLRRVRPPNRPGDTVGGNETEWFDEARLARIRGQARTSWIVDPPEGRLPYTDAGRKQMQAAMAETQKAEGPEQRSAAERCLLGLNGTSGAPLLNARFNSNYQFLQTHDALVIVAEMNHDARIIPIGGRRKRSDLPLWMGDSVAHWSGDTLVVETTNMHPGETLRLVAGGILLVSPQATVVERFTRVARDEIHYEFTVDDPAIYQRRWRGEMPFKATRGPLFEVACHEGNYSMAGILGGARKQEREAADGDIETERGHAEKR